MKWKAFLVYKKKHITHLQQGFDIKAFTDIIHSDSQQIKVGFAFRSFFPLLRQSRVQKLSLVNRDFSDKVSEIKKVR